MAKARQVNREIKRVADVIEEAKRMCGRGLPREGC